MQCDYDINFKIDVVSYRFTNFTRDRKYAKNHRIAIFTADDNIPRIKIETFVGCYRFVAWPDNVANNKCDKPKPKGVT